LRIAGLIHGDFNEFNVMIEFPPLFKYQEYYSSELSEEDAQAYKRKCNS